MTGSASNLTTQWTFRDGRDYVLSLTTTEVPSTISFWISDKITGEEWTGCYDENCIEVLTKRTGCFKSFSTFLSMIKSAILKKSESVVLELLNIHDLAAISIHRQGSLANENEIRSSPLNFPLYNSTQTVTSASNQSTRSQNAPTDTNSHGISNSNNNKTSSLSALNKRKYLIVSYVGEFDKVHYPLPLNYSNPPDLSVMQNNIMKLKAEVTSLRSAKKELEERLESFNLSGGMPKQYSHENNNNDAMPTRLNDEIGQISALINQNRVENNGNQIVHGTGEKIMAAGVVDYPTPNTASSVASSCSMCSNILPQLRATIRNLENAISNEKQKHRQTMEKIEAENHFLRKKVDASEKYQAELRNQIASLQEKADIKEMRNEKLNIEVIKDNSKNRMRQSRHDLFYRPQSIDNSKGRSRTKPAVILANKLRSRGGEDSPNRRRSNSSSAGTGSYSHGGLKADESIVRKNSKEICRNRSPSPYTYNYVTNKQESTRIPSLSPAKRFDPTAYVFEKKAKQNKITDLRMQKIRSRIGTRSPGRCQFNHSPSPSRSPSGRYTHSRNSVSPLPRYMRSLSREMRDGYTELKLNADSLKDRLEKRVHDGKNRPLSADIWKSRIPSPVSRRPCTGNGKSPEKFGSKSQSNGWRNRESYSDRVSRNAPTFPSELRDHILRSPAAVSTKTANRGNLNKPKTNTVALNTSWSCDRLEYLVAKHGRPKSEPNDERDIIVLQDKLSALNAFLETCKTKSKDKDGKEAVAKAKV